MVINRLLSLIITMLVGIIANSQSYLQFIENNGQWNNAVNYKADIPSGVIFMERNCLTFNMFNQAELHQCDHNVDNEEHSETHNHEHYFGQSINCHAFKKHFKNSNPNVRLVEGEAFSHYYNYFLGNDESKWKSRVKAFKAIKYLNLYNSIDMLAFQPENGAIKFDYIVHPGGNPAEIQIILEGIEEYGIEKGQLVINTNCCKIVEDLPFSYQIINNDTVEVNCSYKIDNGIISFKTGNYNPQFPLIIDPPTLVFSTFSGSFSNNFGYSAAFDSKGHLYSGSSAFGPDYPTSLGAYQTSFGGGHTDIAITKWALDGSSFIYSTLIGGSDDELPHSLFVSEYNEVFVLGTTGSTNYPVTSGAYDNSFGGGDYFVPSGLGMNYEYGCDIVITKLKNDGSALLASTYVGGSGNDGINALPSILKYNYADEVRGEIILDMNQNVYVVSCTNSSDFPTSSGAYQSIYGGGLNDACVFKMTNDLSSMMWSTYLGGSGDDAGYSITLSPTEELFISGGTTSTNFPTSLGVYSDIYMGGESDGFIANLTNSGGLISSTYFGSYDYDQCYFVQMDAEGFVYVLGQTESTGSTMVFNAAYSVPNSGQFVAKLSPELNNLQFSTVFGDGSGIPSISPTAFLVDYCNKIYISGWGGNTNGPPYGHGGNTFGLPTTTDAYQETTDGSDFYLVVLEDDASALVYGTFMGSATSAEHVDGGTSRFDRKGKIYEAVCAGCWGDSGFPTTAGAWSNVNNNSCNLAVFKFDFNLPLVAADFDAPYDVCAPFDVDFENLSYNANIFHWDFGDGTSSDVENPSHVYTTPGTYLVTLTATNDTTCNSTDSITKIIEVHVLNVPMPADTFVCIGYSVPLDANTGMPGDEYHWSSNSNFTDFLNGSLANSGFTAAPLSTTTYFVSIANSACLFEDSVIVEVHNINIQALTDTTICAGDTISITANNLNPGDIVSYNWSPGTSLISDSTSNTVMLSPEENISLSLNTVNQYGCIKNQTINIELSEVEFALSYSNPLCWGQPGGSANLTISSGLAPLTSEWSNGTFGNSVTGLYAGNHSVTVTDQIGCEMQQNFTLTQPPYLNVGITDIIQTECDGLCSGSATIFPTGGTPAYYYNWINGIEEAVGENLCAGTYTITVTDINGCDTVVSVTITDPSDLIAGTGASNPASCYGYCDGSASVTVDLGNPPYTYSWSSGSSTNSASGLCAGVYQVTVIDAENCVRIVFPEVDHPSAVVVSIAETSSAICSGDPVDLSASAIGGTPGYTYFWPSPLLVNDAAVSGLEPGTYTVIATDSHNCKDTLQYTISEIPPISFDTTMYPVACLGACNGELHASFAGGVPPFSYHWSNGSTSSYVTGLCAGDYSVTVSDTKGCANILELSVGISPEPPPLDVTADRIYLYSGENTRLHATYDEDYDYFWENTYMMSNPLSPNPFVSPLITTTYDVIIFDENGCSNRDSITIYVTDLVCDEPFIYVPNAFSPNGDGINDMLYVYGDMLEEIHFMVFNRWGQIVFETKDASKGWDGNYNGRPADPAVFDYYLKATCLGKLKFEKKGNITLIR
ncbi:MAG: gliding motility-associated C-terminal domain-containing protein [Bacteroidales bacterium]|nr:gliding motility-associated C-terminal domain-containing protein [Bacteroidales bacterium]